MGACDVHVNGYMLVSLFVWLGKHERLITCSACNVWMRGGYEGVHACKHTDMCAAPKGQPLGFLILSPCSNKCNNG